MTFLVKEDLSRLFPVMVVVILFPNLSSTYPAQTPMLLSVDTRELAHWLVSCLLES